MINEKKIKAYALKNAVEHQGKAVIGSVINSLFNEGLKREKIKDILPEINRILKQINSLKLDEQRIELEKLQNFIGHRNSREGLPELPGLKNRKVIMRFRPAPSGPLHIGHILSNLPSSIYAEKYKGKFYVIIDDTNPEEAIKESYQNIKKDCDWIFGNVYRYINASDRIKIYYEYAERLIKKGFAYVCECEPDDFKKLLIAQESCHCRELSKEEQFKRWKKMLDKKGYNPGEAVLRFKSNLMDKNPAMRDFPLARINTTKHVLQGNKYKVWPLMNLAVPIDDIELKMTHIIRGKDHMDNSKRQEMIFKSLDKKFPLNFFIGRIKFTDLVLSKRKISELIKKGEFSGDDDKKLATISSLRKRGYSREAFVKFVEQRGISEVDKVISQKDFFQVLDNFNRNS